MVKKEPAMQETWFQSLGWKDPLEKEMITHSVILAWKIQWTEKRGGLQSTGSQKLDTTKHMPICKSSTEILVPSAGQGWSLESDQTKFPSQLNPVTFFTLS